MVAKQPNLVFIEGEVRANLGTKKTTIINSVKSKNPANKINNIFFPIQSVFVALILL